MGKLPKDDKLGDIDGQYPYEYWLFIDHSQFIESCMEMECLKEYQPIYDIVEKGEKENWRDLKRKKKS